MKPSAATGAQRTRSILRHLHPAGAMSPSAGTAAPWRHDFLSHIDTMDEPSFVLSTLHRVPSSSASKCPGDDRDALVPRARTVIFRGLWASLPANPRNPAPLNPAGAFETDLPTITTDARMEKVPELLHSTAGDAETGEGEAQASSGRGGPIEAVFWMPKVRTQWRIRGHAYVIGPDIDTPAAAPVRTALQAHMRPGTGADSWSWSRELTAHFGNLSPLMRGTFRNPSSGTPLTGHPPGEGEGLGQRVEDLEDELARRNFRVVVLVPEEADRVDLTDPERGRRCNYRLDEGSEGDKAGWRVTELWP